MAASKKLQQLTPALVLEVQQLLEHGGNSIRAIGRRLGISYESVRRIKLGQHATQVKAVRHRCTGCGGSVMIPCLACHLREAA